MLNRGQAASRPAYLLVAPGLDGHRSEYVRYVADQLSPSDVSVATEDADHLDRVTGLSIDLSAPANAAVRYLRVFRMMRGARERVIFLEADASVAALVALATRSVLRLPRAKVSALVMRSPMVAGATARARARYALKRSLLRLASLSDKTRVVLLTDPGSPLLEHSLPARWATVLDPIELNPGDLPTELNAVSRPWLVTAGYLTERKNVGAILDALGSAQAGTVVFAGEADHATKALLTAALSDTVVWINRWLGRTELDAVIASADVVFALYDNEAPSGVVGKALLAGTPVVCFDSPWFRRLAAAFGGIVLSRREPQSLRNAAVKALSVSSRPATNLGTPAEFAHVLLRR